MLATKVQNLALLARLALAAAFLSAVADRFGLWTTIGSPGVDWGSMAGFYPAVAALNPWLPSDLLPILAWAVTILEFALGLFLIVGYQLPLTSLASGVLLSIFGAAMAIFLGPKLPLNYSVFTAAACAFLLYGLERTKIDFGQAAVGREGEVDRSSSLLDRVS